MVDLTLSCIDCAKIVFNQIELISKYVKGLNNKMSYSYISVRDPIIFKKYESRGRFDEMHEGKKCILNLTILCSLKKK